MAYVMTDDFDDNSIDTDKWDETDTKGRVTEQNNRLELSNPHDAALDQWFQDRLQSDASLSSGIVCVQAYLDWSDEGGNEARGGIFLAKDVDNWAAITSRDTTAGFVRITIYQGGESVYNVDTGLVANGTDFKIEYDVSATTVKFYYWSGEAWTQLGTTQTYDLGTPLYLVFTAQDGNWAANADIIYIDDAYLASGAYATQYPPAPTVPSIIGWKSLLGVGQG